MEQAKYLRLENVGLPNTP